MAYWLLKTEPDCYSYDDLLRDKRTTWDGVANALAQKHIRSVRRGDLALIYLTGNVRAAVGVAQVLCDAFPDPQAGGSKASVFDIKPKRKLARPVTLARIKADPTLAGWDLVCNSRLSVMPVPENIWEKIETFSEEADV